MYKQQQQNWVTRLIYIIPGEKITIFPDKRNRIHQYKSILYFFEFLSLMDSYEIVLQILTVLDAAPRGNSQGHHRDRGGRCQVIVPHGLSHVPHHATVDPARHDPRPCKMKGIFLKCCLFLHMILNRAD